MFVLVIKGPQLKDLNRQSHNVDEPLSACIHLLLTDGTSLSKFVQDQTHQKRFIKLLSPTLNTHNL